MIEAIKEHLSVISLAVTVFGYPALLWHLSKVFAKKCDVTDLSRKLEDYAKGHADAHGDHDDEHDRLSDKIGDMQTRFAAMENEVSHLPSSDDFNKLARDLAAVQAAVNGVASKIDGVTNLVAGLSDQVRELISHELAEGRDAKARNGG